MDSLSLLSALIEVAHTLLVTLPKRRGLRTNVILLLDELGSLYSLLYAEKGFLSTESENISQESSTFPKIWQH
jgi:hypothetical protein